MASPCSLPVPRTQAHHAAAHPGAAYQYRPYVGAEPDAGRSEWRRLLKIAARHRWLITITLIAALVLGLGYTWSQTPLYRASATLEIRPTAARVMQDFDVAADAVDIRTFETARQKLMTFDLAQRVVSALDLVENPAFFAPAAVVASAGAVGSWSTPPEINGGDPRDVSMRAASAAAQVRKNLNAQVIRNTRLLNISYLHADPEIAAAIANQAAKSFIDQTIDAKRDASRQAREFIQAQVIALKQKLEDSEKALVDYARATGITVSGNDASLISQNISDVNASLAKAIDEVLVAERQSIQAREGGAFALPQAAESKSVQETKNRIIELQAAYKEKSATLKPAFPEMRRLNAQIRELQSQMRREVAAIGRAVEIQFEQAKQKELALRGVLKNLELKQSEFQSKTIKYTILKREADSNRSQYDYLIGKLNDAGVGSDLKMAAAAILDPARPPSNPASPLLILDLGVAATLGLVFAITLIGALEVFNNAFADAEQVESELGVPALGVVPRITPRGNLTGQLADEESTLSEAYRSLRTALQFTAADRTIKTLVVTSTEPNEFKTTTAFKLALESAALGQNVLVIDADLRLPALHELFRLENGMGLTNLLSNVGSATVAGIFRQTDHARITLLSVGSLAPNPSELIASHRMGMALHFCAQKFDLVIIDAPPVMGLPDASILARQADATLFVVSARQVSRKAASRALQRLVSSGANVVGAAVTNLTPATPSYRHDYYSAYEPHSEKEENRDHAQLSLDRRSEAEVEAAREALLKEFWADDFWTSDKRRQGAGTYRSNSGGRHGNRPDAIA